MKYEDDPLENSGEGDNTDCLKDECHQDKGCQDKVVPVDKRITEVKKQVAQTKMK